MTVLTKDIFDIIFPYSGASIIFTHDNKPFWDYESFILSVDWMNRHFDSEFHGFGIDKDGNVNLFELGAFMGNTHQETGDPTVRAPYSYWPNPPGIPGPHNGPAGGLMAISEGVNAALEPGEKISFTNSVLKALNFPMTAIQKQITGLETASAFAISLTTTDQPNFGLHPTNTSIDITLPGLVAVDLDGTLYGDFPEGNDANTVKPKSQYPKTPSRIAPPYTQYGGRGAVQLSYNFNYSWITLELFNDYRLARYPNLITTTDRDTWNGRPYYSGFPGPNPNGQNKLPEYIARTTPPARIMAWLTSLAFWMKPRSGRWMSCHTAMQEPFKYGITTTNLIINNQHGCDSKRLDHIKNYEEISWAGKKNIFYIRVCRILGIDAQRTESSIVCPSLDPLIPIKW
jgi:hypothetical protein